MKQKQEISKNEMKRSKNIKLFTRLWQIYSTSVKRNCFCGKKAISRMSSTS